MLLSSLKINDRIYVTQTSCPRFFYEINRSEITPTHPHHKDVIGKEFTVTRVPKPGVVVTDGSKTFYLFRGEGIEKVLTNMNSLFKELGLQ